MIDALLEEHKNRLKQLKGKEEEIDEMYEDYNPCDWSGGNFDDAYELGKEHGDVITEIHMIHKFIKNLEEIQKISRAIGVK